MRLLLAIVLSLTASSASAAGCNFSPKECNAVALCHYATFKEFISQGGKTLWKLSQPQHIKEAKRRGLSCGVKLQWKPNGSLLNAFKSLPQGDKLLVQSTMKDKGYYKSSLDGLYGPGTQKSLIAFGKAEFPELNISEEVSAQELLANIIGSPDPTMTDNQIAEPSVSEQPSISPSLIVEADAVAVTDGDEPVSVTETAPTITSETVLERFNAGDFQTAMLAAQLLAPTGDASAQFILGRLYADGLGVLQQFKLGHMWLNLASLNGSLDAVEFRNNLQVLMPPQAIVEAQAMAVNCIKTNYAECGLPDKVVVKSETSPKEVVDLNQIRSAFRALSVLKRQQIQYALKDLGLYQSSIDASWGKGTSSAISNYISLKDVSFVDVEAVFSSLMSEVDVPNSFQAKPVAKKRVTTRNQNTNAAPKRAFTAPVGWQMFPNVSIAFQQADAICKPQSRNAGVGVTAAPRIGARTSCTKFGNGFDCNSDPYGMQGFADTLERNRAKKDSYNSCMAQYGWKNNNKSNLIESLFGR